MIKNSREVIIILFAFAVILSISTASGQKSQLYIIGFDIGVGSPEETSLMNLAQQNGGTYLSAADATTPDQLKSALTSAYTGQVGTSTSLPTPTADLTGVWSCNDGGLYYIRQLGSQILWYGEQSTTNPGFSNVAKGDISDNGIILEWADVPKGRTMNSGMLTLNTASNGQLVASDKTGGFGGSTWTRTTSADQGAMQSASPGSIQSPMLSTNDLTGIWNSNDGGIYYIRQIGDTIWWYGEQTAMSPLFANIARGTISGNTINLYWSDVPKGRSTSSGTLDLNIVSNSQLMATQKTGGFSGSTWTRQTTGTSQALQGSTSGITLPQSLDECETYTSTVCGTWTLQSGQYSASWDNGATAMITVENWGTTGVVLTRYDSGGSSAGLSARYEGQINGNTIENGKVTWTWKGSTWSGTWNANW